MSTRESASAIRSAAGSLLVQAVNIAAMAKVAEAKDNLMCLSMCVMVLFRTAVIYVLHTIAVDCESNLIVAHYVAAVMIGDFAN